MVTEIKRRHFTTAEYHKMIDAGIFHEDDRIELLGGELLAMSPIGSKHAGCVSRLNHLFFRKLGEDVIIHPQNPVELDEESEPQPDLTLLKPRADFYSQAHPKPEDIFLLIEVADTTINYDRRVKLPFYAKTGVKEVWLIDLSGEQIEIYRNPSKKGYGGKKIAKDQDSVTIQAFPAVEFKVAEILG